MIPDYCDALTAYRAWTAHENGLLVGQTHEEPWPPYEPFHARCGRVQGAGIREHVKDGRWLPAPVWGCDCGVHALKSLEAAEARYHTGGPTYIVVGLGEQQKHHTVWGAVKIWGRIIEHSLGYRAEFAYPSELYTTDEKIAAAVCALYGVPCEVRAVPAFSFEMSSTWVSMINPSFVRYSPITIGLDWSSVSDDAAQGQDSPKPLATLPQIGATDWQKKQAQNPTSRPKRNGFRDTSRFIVNGAS